MREKDRMWNGRRERNAFGGVYLPLKKERVDVLRMMRKLLRSHESPDKEFSPPQDGLYVYMDAKKNIFNRGGTIRVMLK